MKRYQYLIFDADHTLYDYIADEYAAFRALYAELGLPISDALLTFSRNKSEEVWTQAGLYDVNSERIQREYHRLYRAHVKGIFEQVFEQFPCAEDPARVGERFLYHLSKQGNPYPSTLPVLSALSKKQGGRYAITVATNGLSFIQEGRLQALRPYVEKVFVSEAVGAIKPLVAFFQTLLKELGAAADECLMIGDSFSSDIVGAKAAGIDACWYNPTGAQPPNDCVTPDYVIQDLQELTTLL